MFGWVRLDSGAVGMAFEGSALRESLNQAGVHKSFRSFGAIRTLRVKEPPTTPLVKPGGCLRYRVDEGTSPCSAQFLSLRMWMTCLTPLCQ